MIAWLSAVVAASVALELGPVEDVDAPTAAVVMRTLLSELKGRGVSVETPPGTAGCRTTQLCATEARTRTGASTVVVLRLIGGLTRVRAVVERCATRGPPTRAEANLGPERSTWPELLRAVAESLFPESGAYLPTEPPAVAEGLGTPSIVGLTLVGVAVVAAGAGLGFGQSSASARDSLESEPRSDEAFQRLSSRAQTHATVANVFFAIGAFAGVGGLLSLSFD